MLLPVSWRWRVAAAVLAAAVVWLASAELAWPARTLVVVLLAVLPPFAVAQAGAAEPDVALLPRIPVYLSSSAALWLLAVAALVAGLKSGFTPADVGLIALPGPALTLWTLGMLGGALALAAVWRAVGVRESPTLIALLPRTDVERVMFAGLALSAGVSEELVFRGFLVAALAVATGYTWLAVALAATAFGILHAYQNPTGVARAGLLGLLLTVPLLVTGSVIPSMLAHFLYDIVAGLWLADWLLRR